MKKIIFSIVLIGFINIVFADKVVNKFYFAQIRYNGDWDPYPDVYKDILYFLKSTTSIESSPERVVVSLENRDIFNYPFLFLIGKKEFSFTNKEREYLRKFLLRGGFLFIDNASTEKGIGFDNSIRKELSIILQDYPLKKLEMNHTVFHSFYLLTDIGGRRIIQPYLEGVDIEDRTAIIYSLNDITGIWVKDKLGNYIYNCVPGSEKQRLNGLALFMNIIVYSLTGTYKDDKVHQPFLQQKLRRVP